MRYVDLSIAINEKTPVYPGDPLFELRPAAKFESKGYLDYFVGFGTHIGTHVDAPGHMLPGQAFLNDLPLERFHGRGILIDARQGFDLATIKTTHIERGDAVLFLTGMADKLLEPVYMESFPAMSVEIAQYLVERGVNMIGVDAGSVDNQEAFPIHKTLLGGGVVVIENLTNLEQLAGKQFRVMAFPIKVELEAAPARVVAEIQ